jgi:arylsulfatase A-like enzyme
MSENAKRKGRGFLIGAGVLAVLAVYFSIAHEPSNNRLDTRPKGDVEDIAQLAERDDVNVLFILIDTLRAHRLDSYGYTRKTSPTVSYLAGTGARFARHLAQSSWTKASMASLWLGLNPMRTGVTRFAHALPDEATLPAEILRDAGFRTAGIWRNGWVAPNFGFAQGFEFYHRPVGRPAPGGFRRENPNISIEGTDQDVVDAAVEFLRIHAAKRFFLYVHLMDVHQYLYDTESAVFGVEYSDIYDNSVLHEDGVVLQLLAALATEQILDRTLVVVGSDHGEAFGERGLEGHARHVYRESTEVPFVISFPFRLERGIAIHTPSRNVDVWPTLLDLLGMPELPETDGRSMVPEILAGGRGESPPRPVQAGIAHLDRNWGRMEQPSKPAVAVTDGRFRFVYEENPDDKTREELFAQQSGAAELENILEQEPEQAERMRAIAQEYLTQSPLWEDGAPIVEIDHMERNQLRALGYAVE